MSDLITISDFAKIEIRVGEVEKAEAVAKSERLIRLLVDFGAEGKRTIFTGVRTYGYEPSDFAGKRFLFVVNLEPKKMMGEESQGMILAVDGSGENGEEKPLFVETRELPVGAKVR